MTKYITLRYYIATVYVERGDNMPVSQAQKIATAKYEKENYDKLLVRFPKGTKERILNVTSGSVNNYIIQNILSSLEIDEGASAAEIEEPQSAPQAANSREIPENIETKPEAKEIDLQALYEEYGKDAILSVMGQINIMEKYGNEVLQDLVKYAKDQDAEQAPDSKQDFSDVPFMN